MLKVKRYFTHGVAEYIWLAMLCWRRCEGSRRRRGAALYIRVSVPRWAKVQDGRHWYEPRVRTDFRVPLPPETLPPAFDCMISQVIYIKNVFCFFHELITSLYGAVKKISGGSMWYTWEQFIEFVQSIPP